MCGWWNVLNRIYREQCLCVNMKCFITTFLKRKSEFGVAGRAKCAKRHSGMMNVTKPCVEMTGWCGGNVIDAWEWMHLW